MLAEDTGADLLAYVKHVHPRAKRGLMVDRGAWGDKRTTEAILSAMALGHIDYYVLKPWGSPDEFFHRTITEFLHEWQRQVGQGTAEVEVVGERWSPKVHELTTLLSRNGFPHVFHPRDSEEGRRILRECGCKEDNVPVVRILRKKILRDPSQRSWRPPTGCPRGSTAPATATSTSWWSALGRPDWPRPWPRRRKG